MDKVGIVTITYNSAKVIQSFLDCIWEQTYDNFGLYVIDNASIDNTLVFLHQCHDARINIIKNKKNFGVAKANNQGIIRAIEDGCNQILIINNDVQFEPNLLYKLLKVQKDTNCSLVSPKIMFFDSPKHIWYAGGFLNMNRGYLPSHRGIHEVDEGQYDVIQEVEYAPTCCLLVKAEVFQDVGLMNEKYFVYFDDTDFAYRIYRDARHKIFYFPDVKFYHKVGSLTKSFNKNLTRIYRSDFFIKQNFRNHVYFLRQIGGFFSIAFIVWLFFRNNLRFIFNPKIRKNFSTWCLINKSYFEGLKM